MPASRATPRTGRSFGPPGRAALGLLDADAAAMVMATSDLALVVDRAGVIVDVAHAMADPTLAPIDGWVGRRWADTVSPDSRAKVDLLLKDVAAAGQSPRRQVNHVTPDGLDIPVAYNAVRLGGDGLVVAVGRDLRALSQLQQRLIDTQQSLERDYWRLRHVETRWRLLFQLTTDAVLVVDAQTRKVTDANAAAAALFGHPVEKLVGRAFPLDVPEGAGRALEGLLAATRLEGRSEDVELLLADGRVVRASASCFRQEAQTLFLVRFAGAAAPTARSAGVGVMELLANAPDAFVVTTLGGEILSANRAFLDLAQLGDAAQAVGQTLANWIGRPGADLPVLLTMLKKHGALRLVSTAARGEHGVLTEVELSAVWAPEAEPPAIAFLIRDVGRRVGQGVQGARDLTRAVEQLTSLVGRVSLPELLRDTVELVERHFIEAALELTHDNRTAAAEVLGLSRQSLYLKLRRHRLLPAEVENEQAG